MLMMKNILREGNKNLKKISQDVLVPISDADKKILMDMLSFVVTSQDEELNEKLNLRPAVGLAAPQIGILKRMFVIVSYDFLGNLFILPLVNPKIISHSEDVIYLPGGEGCLSVDRKTEGITPRYKSVSFQAYKYDYKNDKFDFIKMDIDDYISIIFQHELDHLNGILFVDKVFDTIDNASPLLIPKNEEDSI